MEPQSPERHVQPRAIPQAPERTRKERSVFVVTYTRHAESVGLEVFTSLDRAFQHIKTRFAPVVHANAAVRFECFESPRPVAQNVWQAGRFDAADFGYVTILECRMESRNQVRRIEFDDV